MSQEWVSRRAAATGNRRRIDATVGISSHCGLAVITTAQAQSDGPRQTCSIRDSGCAVAGTGGPLRVILDSDESGSVLAGGGLPGWFYWAEVGWTTWLADSLAGMAAFTGFGLGGTATRLMAEKMLVMTSFLRGI